MAAVAEENSEPKKKAPIWTSLWAWLSLIAAVLNVPSLLENWLGTLIQWSETIRWYVSEYRKLIYPLFEWLPFTISDLTKDCVVVASLTVAAMNFETLHRDGRLFFSVLAQIVFPTVVKGNELRDGRLVKPENSSIFHVSERSNRVLTMTGVFLTIAGSIAGLWLALRDPLWAISGAVGVLLLSLIGAMLADGLSPLPRPYWRKPFELLLRLALNLLALPLFLPLAIIYALYNGRWTVIRVAGTFVVILLLNEVLVRTLG